MLLAKGRLDTGPRPRVSAGSGRLICIPAQGRVYSMTHKVAHVQIFSQVLTQMLQARFKRKPTNTLHVTAMVSPLEIA